MRPEEIGKGAHPAQNPPRLSEADHWILDWYFKHCTGFTMDFHIVGGLIEKLHLREVAMELLIQKLSAIHEMMVRVSSEEAKDEMGDI